MFVDIHDNYSDEPKEIMINSDFIAMVIPDDKNNNYYYLYLNTYHLNGSNDRVSMNARIIKINKTDYDKIRGALKPI